MIGAAQTTTTSTLFAHLHKTRAYRTDHQADQPLTLIDTIERQIVVPIRRDSTHHYTQRQVTSTIIPRQVDVTESFRQKLRTILV